MKRLKYHAVCLALALVMVALFAVPTVKAAFFTKPEQVVKIQPVGAMPDRPEAKECCDLPLCIPGGDPPCEDIR